MSKIGYNMLRSYGAPGQKIEERNVKSGFQIIAIPPRTFPVQSRSNNHMF